MEEAGLKNLKPISNKAPVSQRLILCLATLALLFNFSCFRKSAIVQQALPAPTASPIATPSAFPTPDGFISDFAKVFDESGKQKLELAVADLKRELDVEFGVATIETTNGVPIFDYSLALAREWKPGGKSGRGLLLVLAIKDRQWRLQVSKALEKELPDDVCKELGDQSVELYKAGKYAEGVEKYVKAIAEKLKAQRPKSVAAVKAPSLPGKRASGSIAGHQVV